jgi:hypothetical protein
MDIDEESFIEISLSQKNCQNKYGQRQQEAMLTGGMYTGA